jgi:hypothetical protein
MERRLDVKKIKLTRGQVALVDDEDYADLSQFKWRATWQHSMQSFYAVRDIRLPNGKWTKERMHRRIMGLQYGDKRQSDHKNGNTLDNQRSNLRIATNFQNARNRKIPSNSTTGVTGVWKVGKKWGAVIQVNHSRLHFGRFADFEIAVAVRRAAEKILFGEFAPSNCRIKS